ncbi:MAG: electron transfer flavoprotein subunit alpha/FixB family protein [Planctomycetota bacterium]
MSNILVFVELKSGAIRKSSLEAVSEASRLAKNLGGSVTAVTVGTAIGDAGAVLGKAGANEVITIQDEKLNNYSGDGFAVALHRIVGEKQPAAIFFAATPQGKDLAPRVAVLANSGLASDCIGFSVENGKIRAKRPVYAGKAYITVEAASGILAATLRPNVFAHSETGSPVTVVNKNSSTGDVLAIVKEVLSAVAAKLDVTEAPVVISGGRGLKGPEHWGLIDNLAKAFGGNAAIGATRAVVDAGWRPHDEQVGQTGKTVAPTLYIACGISGAIQHLAGMSSSRVIVAINKDPEAPIFKVADYGIVGDVFEVLPVLTEAVKALTAAG